MPIMINFSTILSATLPPGSMNARFSLSSRFFFKELLLKGRAASVRLVLVVLGLAGATPASAQWVTQTLDLKQGWNAVYLHVDASHATLDELVGASAPELTPIEQIWRWTPDEAMAQFITSPQQPVESGSQWSVWRRTGEGLSNLPRVHANFAYLVYATEPYVWSLKGKPVLPRYQWVTSGLNFVGFPTVAASAPSFENFLAEAPLLQLLLAGTGGIYRYTGGEFSPTNPGKLFLLQTTPVRRGEAYWIQAGQPNYYNKYYGPFEVVSGITGALEFGDQLSSAAFRLRNQTSEPLTVTLRLRASEAAPTGQPSVVALPPLLLRGELNATDLTHGLIELGADTPQTWTLEPQGQPGSDVEVVVGLDRANLTQPVGALLAGVLELTDSLGHTRVDLGVTAEAASQAGLWIGGAAVGKVSQYLKNYAKVDDRPVVQEDGSYQVESMDTSLQAVPAAYPLRLIVHNPAETSGGPAVLLQQVFYGLNAEAEPVVTTRQSGLDARYLAQARRLSAAHLPWTQANTGWDFSGRLQRGGGGIQATVVTPYDAQASNPFLHTYHPDHDNLDARFENQVTQGSESYRIERQIRLEVQPPEADFRSRVTAGLALTGKYAETIRLVGLARAGGTFDTREFTVEGVFSLQRATDIPTLNRNP